MDKKKQNKEMCDQMAVSNIETRPTIQETEEKAFCVKLDNVEEVRKAIIYSEIINRKY